MPKKLQYLTDRLPKSNYSLNLSYEDPKRTLEKPKKEERERTSNNQNNLDTLPKLERVIRYH